MGPDVFIISNQIKDPAFGGTHFFFDPLRRHGTSFSAFLAAFSFFLFIRDDGGGDDDGLMMLGEKGIFGFDGMRRRKRKVKSVVECCCWARDES